MWLYWTFSFITTLILTEFLFNISLSLNQKLKHIFVKVSQPKLTQGIFSVFREYFLSKGFKFGRCENGLFVFPNLDVYMCPFFDRRLGNLRKENLNFIYKMKKKFLENSNYKMFNDCSECGFREKGFCRPCLAYSL